MAFQSEEDKKAYWRKNLNLMFSLLVIWALVSYGFGILLRPVMDAIPVGGVGLGFWFAQQGSIVVFVLLILVYSVLLNRLDAQHSTELSRLRQENSISDSE